MYGSSMYGVDRYVKYTEMKTFVLFMDILGFDKLMEYLAKCHNLPDVEPIRKNIVDFIEDLLNHFKNENLIIEFKNIQKKIIGLYILII